MFSHIKYQSKEMLIAFVKTFATFSPQVVWHIMSIFQIVQDELCPVIMSSNNACLSKRRLIWAVIESVSSVWHLNFLSRSAWVICHITPPVMVDLFHIQMSCLKCVMTGWIWLPFENHLHRHLYFTDPLRLEDMLCCHVNIPAEDEKIVAPFAKCIPHSNLLGLHA